MVADGWSTIEIDLIVADYFEMLANELAGLGYNKAEHNRQLQTQIERNRASIEFEHQNISAILMVLGQLWITGYKPAVNFQNALADGVLRWLNSRDDWLNPQVQIERASSNAVLQNRTLWMGPPPTHRNEPPPFDITKIAALGRKYDVAARDERNRALGKAGEELVLLSERAELSGAGLSELAAKVRWTAVEDGDGFGYDIRSFEKDGREKLIEVKTTNGWDRTPFHISANEVRVARERREDWHLYRVWNFAREPRAFVLRPPMEQHAELTATSFLAKLH